MRNMKSASILHVFLRRERRVLHDARFVAWDGGKVFVVEIREGTRKVLGKHIKGPNHLLAVCDEVTEGKIITSSSRLSESPFANRCSSSDNTFGCKKEMVLGEIVDSKPANLRQKPGSTN